jgi:hypothetical protein
LKVSATALAAPMGLCGGAGAGGHKAYCSTAAKANWLVGV